MHNALLVGLGGFVGSVSRFLIYTLIKNLGPLTFPIATLLVNVLGCFAMGALIAALERLQQSNSLQIFLFFGTGILGGFTTFSTFSAETISLMKNSQFMMATLSIVANITLSVGAAALGRILFTAAP